MSWIREAEHDGMLKALDEADAKRRFASEEVTEESVTQFLKPFETPVITIIKDLEDAGYILEKTGPDFLHHSFQGYPGTDEDRSRFSLTKREESTGWGMTNYSKMENLVFGVQWLIRKLKTEKPPHEVSDYDELGTITLYPYLDGETHFAGVQYRTETDFDYHNDRNTFDVNAVGNLNIGGQSFNENSAKLTSAKLKSEVTKMIEKHSAKNIPALIPA